MLAIHSWPKQGHQTKRNEKHPGTVGHKLRSVFVVVEFRGTISVYTFGHGG